MTKTAVVILNFNGKKYLESFLPALKSNTENAEIIIADNASTDDSIDFLKAHHPDVRIVQLLKNFGFAGGYNEALQQIDSEYCVLINSDVEVSNGWLTPLISFLDSNPSYAAVQPKILDWNKRTHFEYAGAAGGYLDTFGFPYCRGRIFDTLEEDHRQYDTIADVHWTSGACMAIRSKVFHDVGGLDDDFFAHMEEIDLCWRLRSIGWKLACNPKSIVFHVGGGTLHKSSPRKTYLNFRNGLSLLLKNLPWSHLIWKLPVRLVLDGVAAIKFAIETSPSHLMAILKAHFHFYGRMSRNIKKRKASSPLPSKNLIINYFLRKKRTYSALHQ